MTDLAPSLAASQPELLLGLAILAFLTVASFMGDRALRPISWAAVLTYAAAGAFMLDDPARQTAWGGLFVNDRFAQYLKALILLAAAASTLLALPYLRRVRAGRFEYPILLMLGTLGMLVMVSANDLITLYIGLELQSLAAYVLAAFHRGEARSSEAGLKYFVLGALSSGILLFGASLVYGFAGTTGFAGLAQALGPDISTGALIGLVFVMVGLAFKVSAVPFHMWTPDVYEGAPTPVAAFFAAAPKVAAMGLLVRAAMEAFGGASDSWRQIVAFMAVASMFLGAVGAIGQANIKRLLAYSSINNIGFALIGLAAATQAGVSSVLVYMAIYIAMTLGSFIAVLELRDLDGRPVEEIAALAGLHRQRPGLAAAIAVFMFSLAGIPPLMGFWPKFSVFEAAVDAGLFPLAILGVIASVIGAYYYLRIIKTIYFDEAIAALPRAGALTVNGALMAAAALFCTPLGWFALSPLAAAASAAAASLALR